MEDLVEVPYQGVCLDLQVDEDKTPAAHLLHPQCDAARIPEDVLEILYEVRV